MERKPKICVYAICKNESKFVDRWVNALQEADCIVVMDTGSTDNTVELLQQYSPFVTVKQQIINPWRFDTARNESMKMIPEDADICVVSDLDQVFRPGWADELRRLYNEGYEEIYGPIIDYDENGNEEKRFLSKNVHPNDKSWYWERPIHEGVHYHGDSLIKTITSDNFVIEHRQDKSKSRASYLDLLETEYKENSKDLLCAIYYSCELYFHGRLQDALDVIFKSYELCDFDNADPSEQYIMYLNTANLLIENGEVEHALTYYYKAKTCGINTRKLFMCGARIYGLLDRREESIQCIKQALSVKENVQSWIEEDIYFKENCYDELSLQYYYMKDYIHALCFGTIALDKSGDRDTSNRIIENMGYFIKDLLKEYLGDNYTETDKDILNTTRKSLFATSETKFENGEYDVALGLVAASIIIASHLCPVNDDGTFITKAISLRRRVSEKVNEHISEMISTKKPILKFTEEVTTNMSKENKVCVYAICKNESQFVDKWIESMKEADLIVVLDTGSDDDTLEHLKRYENVDGVNIMIAQQVIKPWRFDTARNCALQLVPEEYNILVSTDLDEVLEPGWAQQLRDNWVDGVHERGNYKYSWSHLSNGESGRVFVYDKVHSRDWIWKHPVHELLWNVKTQTNHYSYENTLNLFDTMHLHHYPDMTKSRGSYLGLLELRAEECDDDYYGLIYLAHEYYYQGQYENSIATLNKVLEKHQGEYTTVEEASCYLFMGDSYFALKLNEKAMDSYLKAISIEPTYREPYLDLVKVLLDEKRYIIAKNYISECLKKTYRHYTWLERDTSWTHEPYDLMALALYYSGDKIGSLSFAVKAYGYDPEDKRLRDNVNLILESISDDEWANIK